MGPLTQSGAGRMAIREAPWMGKLCLTRSLKRRVPRQRHVECRGTGWCLVWLGWRQSRGWGKKVQVYGGAGGCRATDMNWGRPREEA